MRCEGVHEIARPIEITRLERSAVELRELAVKTEDSDVVRRLLGIALLLDGWLAAKRRRPVAWTGRCCTTGCIATTGLVLLAWQPGRCKRPPALNEAQMAELKELVDQKGPGSRAGRCCALALR